MKGCWIQYSEAEMAWLEHNRSLVIGEYHRAFCQAFGRDDVSAPNLHALRKRKGWRTGRTGCFPKGAAPHNKGQKCAPGTGGLHPNAMRSHFAKGVLSGRAAEFHQPIGTERISGGYRERKIHDGMPFQSRWKLVHRIEWEAVNGPVPKGMALKCLGDRMNTDPSNWTLVPRAMLPRLNGGRNKVHIAFDDAPDELKPAVMAVARLEYASRSKRGAA